MLYGEPIGTVAAGQLVAINASNHGFHYSSRIGMRNVELDRSFMAFRLAQAPYGWVSQAVIRNEAEAARAMVTSKLASPMPPPSFELEGFYFGHSRGGAGSMGEPTHPSHCLSGTALQSEAHWLGASHR